MYVYTAVIVKKNRSNLDQKRIKSNCRRFSYNCSDQHYGTVRYVLKFYQDPLLAISPHPLTRPRRLPVNGRPVAHSSVVHVVAVVRRVVSLTSDNCRNNTTNAPIYYIYYYIIAQSRILNNNNNNQ